MILVALCLLFCKPRRGEFVVSVTGPSAVKPLVVLVAWLPGTVRGRLLVWASLRGCGFRASPVFDRFARCDVIGH